jgi:hypothetical protein
MSSGDIVILMVSVCVCECMYVCMHVSIVKAIRDVESMPPYTHTYIHTHTYTERLRNSEGYQGRGKYAATHTYIHTHIHRATQE